MGSSFVPMHTVIPEGRHGHAHISHQVVSQSESDLTRLRAAINGRPEEFVRPGTYCRLFVKEELAMSDTIMEHNTNNEIVHRATGKVLIAGLGIGMILVPIAKKEDVTEIVVVEQSADVIKLVYPNLVAYFKGTGDVNHKKFRVDCADIHEWVPLGDERFDTIYFDIWPTIWPDNLEEMVYLESRFRPLLKDNATAWMDCWSRTLIERELRSYR